MTLGPEFDQKVPASVEPCKDKNVLTVQVSPLKTFIFFEKLLEL
jgi:hypothetical protein